MPTQKITTHSSVQTQDLGKHLVQKYSHFWGHQPIIFALQGELGAGKTQFVKGIAQGLGISALITSPSYALVNEYSFHHQNKVIPLIHIDAWRLPSADDLQSLGWERFLQQKAIIALEWPDLSQLKIDADSTIISLHFAYEPATDDRTLTIQEPGEK